MTTTKQERIAFRRRWRRRMAQPVDDSYCFGSGKIRYRSEDDARSEASRIAVGGPALFVYWCQFCHGPHLTKQRPRSLGLVAPESP